MRSVCAFPSKPPISSAHSLSARSPLWPNGGWPRSWLRQAVSTTSGDRRSAVASSRPDLRDLERVREAVAGEVGGARRAQHLRLGGEAAKRRRMQHAGTVASEGVPLRSVLLVVESLGVLRLRSRRAGRARRRRRPQPPLWSSSASARAQDASTPRSRESSHPSGRAGRLGVPARPRWPSAAAPGYGASSSSVAEELVDLGEARHGREAGAGVSADRVALEVPGDVLADVAAAAVLVFEELDEELRVTAEGLRRRSRAWHRPARRAQRPERRGCAPGRRTATAGRGIRVRRRRRRSRSRPSCARRRRPTRCRRCRAPERS